MQTKQMYSSKISAYLRCNTGLHASYSLQPTGSDQQKRNQESEDDPSFILQQDGYSQQTDKAKTSKTRQTSIKI